MWRRSGLFRILSLGGYVAFDVPRVVAGLGASLLIGVAAAHGYLLLSCPGGPPWYFVGYAAPVIIGCAATAPGLWLGSKPVVVQASWFAGSALSSFVLVVDVVTRMAGVPGMPAITGRWDVAPATFALAFAGAFVAVHTTVLVGINVAYPQRQHWAD
jgi:hypothetical protein